ncbi:MAG: DNRLRE domain-containing protein, partial [Acidobacteria bacterium]|nr:DNRLRE domain-containing protein [Acidobacteriota bacterium]
MWLGWGRWLGSFSASGQRLTGELLAEPVEGLASSPEAAEGPSRLWLATASAVRALDPVTGARVGALELPSGAAVEALAVGGDGSVWVSQGSALHRYEASGELAATVAAPALSGLSATGLGDVWGRSGGELYRWGLRGSRLEQLSVEAFEASGPQGSAGEGRLVADPAGGSVWASEGREVRRFGASGELADAFEAAGAVRALVWVAGTEAGPAGPDPWAGGTGESESSGPALSVVEPSAFLQVNPGTLEVVLAYAEGASPLDLGSLAVRLDGVEVTASCTAEAAGAVCALGGLGEGLHRVEAELSDTAGEVARVERSFQVLVGEGSHEVALPASADGFVRGWLRNRNEGTTPYLELRLLGPHRSLAAFDLAELAGVVESLEEARLELFVEANAFNWGFGGREVDAHRLLAAWSEAGVTWNCPEDTNPGNFQADCESRWNGGSFDPLPSSSVRHTSETSGWVSFDVTADVGSALSGGESFGWLVKKRQEWLFGLVRYTSKEGEPAQAPRLVVRFTGGEVQDLEPPELTVTAPAEGARLSTSAPALSVSYSDAGTGVDPSSLSFTANGSALAVSCAAGETGATCTPSAALPEGLVTLSATVADLAGNVSPPASVSFTVDTVAPPAVDLGAVEVSPPAAGRVSVAGSAGAAEPGATVRVT